MTKRVCLAATLILVLAAPAMAQRNRGDRSGPAWLARRCIATMERLADRTVHRIGHRTQYCIRTINALLEEGAEDEARAVARRCTHSVNTEAAYVVARIQQLARRCMARLAELGASDRMIAAVRQAGANAVEAVQSAAERATQAIRALFDE